MLIVKISKKAQIMLVKCLFFVYSENEKFTFQYLLQRDLRLDQGSSICL